MDKKIVTFDFDATLSRPDVQEYAKELIEKGIDVWVVTARYDDLHTHLYDQYYGDNPNDDLYEVVDRLGIPRGKVRFNNLHLKYQFLANTNIIWHLDDSKLELAAMKDAGVKTKGIQVESGTWKSKCNKLLGLTDKKEENVKE